MNMNTAWCQLLGPYISQGLGLGILITLGGTCWRYFSCISSEPKPAETNPMRAEISHSICQQEMGPELALVDWASNRYNIVAEAQHPRK